MEQPDEGVVLTIVCDNRSRKPGVEASWGFSCLLRGLEKTILFDTGGEGPILMGNMSELGIDPGEIDSVALSHAHWDHTGGLGDFLAASSDVDVYVLESFPGSISDLAARAGARIRVVTGPTEICPGAVLTGELGAAGGMTEQGLVVRTDSGRALITGCAHPGVAGMAARASEIAGGQMTLVLGGFHLLKSSESSIRSVIEELVEQGVRLAAPCHCTGEAAIEIFRSAYGDGFLDCRAGTVVDLTALLRDV
ncbi:MAG: MBL fold metallo-hydrolase [Candidatus Eisenbacteria bacterium]|nr:MBL fold metallo-hydrolase [Candidatus Eisenbacteria bacterium]